MTDTAQTISTAELALAREMAAGHYQSLRDPDYDPAYGDLVRGGFKDRTHEVQIALAAIRATSERAAKLADIEITRIFSQSASGHGALTARRIRDALRAGQHLEPTP